MTVMSETPRTDARRVTFAEAQVWDDPAGDYVDADFACDLERELATVKRQLEIRVRAKAERNAARAERDALARWKEEQLEVERSWDPQAVGELLGMTIGTPIHQNIQPAIEKLLAQLAAERALADRLAKWLGNALEFDREGDPIPAADIPPSREALAAWKEARSE